MSYGSVQLTQLKLQHRWCQLHRALKSEICKSYNEFWNICAGQIILKSLLRPLMKDAYAAALTCLQNMKKQRVAEAAVDSMKQQMLELCRSDTLSRAREQHDRDLTVIREQHELALLALEQKLDAASQALSEQVCPREQQRIIMQTCQQDIHQTWQRDIKIQINLFLLPDWGRPEVTRAGEAAGAPERRGATGESQSHQRPHSAPGGESATMCQATADKWVKGLPVHVNKRRQSTYFYLSKWYFLFFCTSGSVQEMNQIQIKLQQTQSAKALSENMNKVLQVWSHIFLSQNGNTLKTSLYKKINK